MFVVSHETVDAEVPCILTNNTLQQSIIVVHVKDLNMLSGEQT